MRGHRPQGGGVQPYTRQRREELFWSRVDRSGGDASCWPWTAGRQRAGYGAMAWEMPDGTTKTVGAHRLALMLATGADIWTAYTRHKCDNPVCCNPRHLELGTPKDNVRDMLKRGRANHKGQPGERNNLAKLSLSSVREIRAALYRGETGRSLAARYGVTPACISDIKVGKTWAA